MSEASHGRKELFVCIEIVPRNPNQRPESQCASYCTNRTKMVPAPKELILKSIRETKDKPWIQSDEETQKTDTILVSAHQLHNHCKEFVCLPAKET